MAVLGRLRKKATEDDPSRSLIVSICMLKGGRLLSHEMVKEVDSSQAA